MSQTDTTDAPDVGQGLRCVYCGEGAQTIDHIRPRIFGGTDRPTNLASACKPCNSSKGSTAVARWLLTLLLRRDQDERVRRIVERLTSGELGLMLGPPGPGWSYEETPGEEDQPPGSLAQAIASLAWDDLSSRAHTIHQDSIRVRRSLGSQWADDYEPALVDAILGRL